MKVQEMRKQCEGLERPENLRSSIKVTLGIKILEGICKLIFCFHPSLGL